MNKFYTTIATLMIAPILSVSAASAKCNCHDDANPSQKCECADKANCSPNCSKKMMEDRTYKMHEHKTYQLHYQNKKWIDEAQKEVNKNYFEAVKKVNTSNLEQAQKDLLLKQAEANRDLVLKQIDERTENLKENMQQCMNAKMFAKEAKHDKNDREAVKAVHKILTAL